MVVLVRIAFYIMIVVLVKLAFYVMMVVLVHFFCCCNKTHKAGYFIKNFLTVRSKSMVLLCGQP